MNLEFRGGVKPACSNGFECFERYVFKLNKLFATHYSQFTKKLFAFTLAETLIVMGVIGVVAALTLPNLNQSTNNKEKIAKVKKLYSNLNDAYGRATAVYGPYDEWFVNDSSDAAKIKRAGDRISEFMKTSKNCGMNNGCYTSGSGTSNTYQFILADGATVSMGKDSAYVDIDGLKSKNTAGYDRFLFKINANGVAPHKYQYNPNYEESLSNSYNYCFYEKGYTCTIWVINNGNMDYLNVNSSGKCNNSDVTLSETVTSCK